MTWARSLVASFTYPYWLDDPRFWAATVETEDDGSVEVIRQELEYSLDRRRVGRATNWLALGFRFSPHDFPALAKRVGSLRPSKYRFAGGTLAKPIASVLAHPNFDLSDDARSYLASIRALATLAPIYAQKIHALETFLTDNRLVVLKGLLATVDHFAQSLGFDVERLLRDTQP